MEMAGRTCVNSRKFTFYQQIEKFPWQLRRGSYESPVYYSEITGCNWILFVEGISESADEDVYEWTTGTTTFIRHGDYIEMSLRRTNFIKSYQSIDVCLTIVDALNIRSLYGSKEIHFTPSLNGEIVLRVTIGELFGHYCPLNKVRFMPKGILTLKCEITAYDTAEEKYEKGDKLENTAKYAKKEISQCLLVVFAVIVTVCSVIYIFFYFASYFLERYPPPSRTDPGIITMHHTLMFMAFFIGVMSLLFCIFTLFCPGGIRTYSKSKTYYNIKRTAFQFD